MNRFKALFPRLGLVVAGVAIGLLARQVFGPPEENLRPPLSIDRPIAEEVDLETTGDAYFQINLPVEPLPAKSDQKTGA